MLRSVLVVAPMGVRRIVSGAGAPAGTVTVAVSPAQLGMTSSGRVARSLLLSLSLPNWSDTSSAVRLTVRLEKMPGGRPASWLPLRSRLVSATRFAKTPAGIAATVSSLSARSRLVMPLRPAKSSDFRAVIPRSRLSALASLDRSRLALRLVKCALVTSVQLPAPLMAASRAVCTCGVRSQMPVGMVRLAKVVPLGQVGVAARATATL